MASRLARFRGPRCARLPLLALLVAVTALALPASSSAAPRRVPAGFLGAAWDGAITDAPASVQQQQFASMAAAGVETVRATFVWAAAQPAAGQAPNFARTDAVVAMAAEHKLALLPIVIGTPAWARSSSDLYSPPSDPSVYGLYLTALIGRYGPNGSFWAENPQLQPQPIRTWQIWNEPELSGWFNVGRANWVQKYVALLNAAHAAVKRADPGAKVVLGALTNFSWLDLRRLYRSGARRYFDIAALDPYTHTPSHVLDLVIAARRVMRGFGDARKPLWLGEFGLPASRGKILLKSALQTTDTGMARFLSQVSDELARNARRLGVGRAYWYTWASSYTGRKGGDIWNYTGLLGWDGSRLVERPAFRSYVQVARRLEGCAKTTTASCVAG